ncbi:MAG TPA: hypothetical protein VKA50_09050 [Gammaproteobacteria bacterium]|nr:hypothetical protein [Gammaproteobacteria bacterium]
MEKPLVNIKSRHLLLIAAVPAALAIVSVVNGSTKGLFNMLGVSLLIVSVAVRQSGNERIARWAGLLAAVALFMVAYSLTRMLGASG